MNIKGFYEKHKLIIKIWASILVVLFVYFGYIKLHGNVYLFWGDESQEVVPILTNLYELIRTGKLSLWNWSSGMGSSTFNQFFLFLGSPSFYLYLLVPTKELLVNAIPFIDTIRFLLIGLFSYLWLSKITNKEKSIYIGSMIMTFSGYLLYWVHFSYFMDAYLYLAILLYSMELILQRKKKYLFTIIVCLSAILSIYYAYMFTWFVFIYLTCRLFMLNEKLTMKKYFGEFLYVLKYYFIGIGLSAIVFIPCLFILSTTNRIGATTNLFSIIDIKGIYRVLTSLISPVINDFDYNIYSSPFLLQDNVVYTVYSYSFMIFVLLLPQAIKVKFNGKKPLLITMGVLAIMLLFPLFYFVFNGNTSIRWSFFFVVSNVLLLVNILDNEDQIDKKLLNLSLVFTIAYILIISFVSLQFNLTTDTNSFVIKLCIPVLIAFVCGYTLSFNIKKYASILLTLVIVGESCFCMLLRVQNGHANLLATNQSYLEYKDFMFNKGLIDSIDDDSFYRMEVADMNYNGYNLPTAKMFNGFSQYNSIYNFESLAYIENRFAETWFLPYAHSKFLLKTLWGSKYLIINNGVFFTPHGYTQIDENDYSILYQSDTVMPIGYATNKLTSLEYAESLDKSQEDIVMMNSIITEDSTNTFDTSVQFEPVVKGLVNGSFKFNKKDGYLFFDYSKYITTTVSTYEFYKDGEVQYYGNTNEYGYTAVPVDIDIDEVFIYANNSYNLNEYVPVDVYWLSYDQIDKLYSNISSFDLFTDVKVNGDEVNASINVTNEGSYIATSIPYNPGWHAYVDGKEVKIKNVNLAFVGLDIEPGTHTLRFKFIPKGLYVGMAVSFVSLVILIISIVLDRKKKNN